MIIVLISYLTRKNINMDDSVNTTIPWENQVREAESKAKEKRAKTFQKSTGIPAEMAPRWELIRDEVAKRIKAKRDTIKVAIGEKPYNGIPIDETEAEIRFLQMRDNPELQQEALAANVIKSKDGRLLINKKYLEAITKLEHKYRKGETSS